jgi:LmbE family N-acetylglucosaminyl deacetylase
MRALKLVEPGETVSVLCLGAHADDIEIGAGGTILNWIATGVKMHVHWCVLSASETRAIEAKSAAAAFLTGAASAQVEICQFKDGFFPYHGNEIKVWMEGLRHRTRPDIIFTHCRDDAHQDHREVSQLTWNCFRDHLILEYEIPKWDGDLGQPNVYSALPELIFDQKLELLLAAFGTQRSKDWFNADVFRGLARLRGMECRASQSYAEGFVVRKALLGVGGPDAAT